MSSVRTSKGHQDPAASTNVRSSVWPPYEWGMVSNPQGGQAPGQHKAQPLISTWQWVRAQIGTRPVQSTQPGDAGQSSGQTSGLLRPGPSVRIGIGYAVDEFFYGAEVIHIARFFRAANGGYSGVNTTGRASDRGLTPDGDNAYVMKRPLQRYPTRGPRSISGAMNRKARFDDTGRVASVFVPTAPLR